MSLVLISSHILKNGMIISSPADHLQIFCFEVDRNCKYKDKIDILGANILNG